MIALAVLGILAAVAGAAVMAVFALGSSASALRPRGRHMFLATTGLLLSCIYLGGLVGFFTFLIYFATA